jgi:transcriptional regulator with XRE-family HTH domain
MSNQEAVARAYGIRKTHEDYLLNNLADCVTFGERLLELRGVLDLYQGDLAYILGVTPSTVMDWESNRKTPNLYYVHLLCLCLEVDIGVLMSGVAPTKNNVPASLWHLAGDEPKRAAVEHMLCVGSGLSLEDGLCSAGCGKRGGDGTMMPRHSVRTSGG